MDPKTSRWIMEFLVRRLDDDDLLDKIIPRLPTPDDNYELKKAILLRRIQTELSNGIVSEKLMELMELTSELEFVDGSRRVASEAMKAAYCAVLVDCTVRFLEDFESNGKYIETLRRIWRIRVQRIVLSKNSELISEKLWIWKDDLEAAVSDLVLRRKILSRNTRNEAIKAVKGYLAEAWDDLGPCHLEKVAQSLLDRGEVLEGIDGVQFFEFVKDAAMHGDSMLASNEPDIDGNGDPASSSRLQEVSVDEPAEQRPFEGVEDAVVVPNDGMISGEGPAVDGENCRGKASIENVISVEEPSQRQEHVFETLGTATMPICAMITGDGPSGNGDDSLVAPGSDESLSLHGISPDICSETSKAVQVPAKIADLEEMDEDTPEVGRVKEELESGNKQPLVDLEEMDEDTRKVCRGNKQSPGKNEESPAGSSFEDLREASPGASTYQYHLPSSEIRMMAKRWWTPLEKDTLRTGVKKFGKGNWKLILDAYPDVFQGRTEGGLKEKWRCMVTRRSR